MRANGNHNSAKEGAATRLTSSAGLPSSLRINPAVLAAVLPEAVRQHESLRADAAHRRRYLELHRRHALVHAGNLSEAA